MTTDTPGSIPEPGEPFHIETRIGPSTYGGGYVRCLWGGQNRNQHNEPAKAVMEEMMRLLAAERRRAEALESERDKWHKLCQDQCEVETAIRKMLEPIIGRDLAFGTSDGQEPLEDAVRAALDRIAAAAEEQVSELTEELDGITKGKWTKLQLDRAKKIGGLQHLVFTIEAETVERCAKIAEEYARTYLTESNQQVAVMMAVAAIRQSIGGKQ